MSMVIISIKEKIIINLMTKIINLTCIKLYIII